MDVLIILSEGPPTKGGVMDVLIILCRQMYHFGLFYSALKDLLQKAVLWMS